MIVKHERPPNFDAIDAAFHVEGKPIIFAYGLTIFNPDGGPIRPELIAHEAVHGFRQGDDIEGWWTRYIADPKFRLDEEIPAHQAEYAHFCRNNRAGQARNSRRLYLHHVAARLASPLYGQMIRYEHARKLVKEAIRNE